MVYNRTVFVSSSLPFILFSHQIHANPLHRLIIIISYYPQNKVYYPISVQVKNRMMHGVMFTTQKIGKHSILTIEIKD